MTGFLASVVSLEEARLALQGGADLVDLKNPAEGALGALPLATVRHVVAELGGKRPFSATAGDLPMSPQVVRAAVETLAATGVDYVKIGFFPGGDWDGVLESLTGIARNGARLIAVLFADDGPAPEWIEPIARTGFAGVMLDTRDKRAGSLRDLLGEAELRAFLDRGRGSGLLRGLAGSLREADIAPLLALQPDYLGFRGALCAATKRTAALDIQALGNVRRRIHPLL
ncbi:MAG TPA: (5-formylfuran-3-yl)methyl phosphate synthase [Methylococcaceae bacterium]|nr:(5-formylfuran-3-yl)methyl phosphate synthase [Methylococcaceae bacterium]